MKKTNSAVGIVIAVLITLGCFFCSWQYIIADYKSNQNKLAMVTQEVKDAKTKLESLKTAQSSLSGLGDIVSEMLIAVPEDKDTPNLITELEAVAAKHEIALPTLQISDAASAGAGSGTSSTASKSSSSIGTVSISFSVNSNFENLQQLIYDLEHDIRFMNVQSVSLTSAATAQSAGQMNLSLQLTAYKRANTSLSGANVTSGGLEATSVDATTSGGTLP